MPENGASEEDEEEEESFPCGEKNLLKTAKSAK